MTSRHGRWIWIVLALVFAALPAAAPAQTTTGRIAGTVSDSSGGVLPGASVTAEQEGTGLARTVVTDTRGGYVFVDLPVGTYTVKAEMTGFKTTVKSGYALVADGRIGVDFSLEIGAMTEAVEVTVASETVNTISGELARVVDREQVQNLALNGRNYMQLATLVPGSPVLNNNALDIMVGLSINTSINGSRSNTSLLMVDGGFNMDAGSNNSQISNVGVDFIDQVSIKSSNFSAEYGRNSGAAINVVTRSGSNTLHGSGYEYARNDKLDANDYFAEAAGVAKADLRYNNFGWSLGGPLVKDHVFFFGGEEWKKIRRQTSPTYRTIPTSAMRNGNFSAISTIIKDPETGKPFAGNVIPLDRITADGRAIANVYAAMAARAASYNDAGGANNALFQIDNPFDFRQDMIRLDWQRSAAHRITARLLFDSYDTTDPNGTFISSQLPTIPTQRIRPGRNMQLAHAWTISSGLVNELKANASWNSQRINPVGDTWRRDAYGFAFPQIYTGGGRFEDSIPNVSVTNFASFEGASRALLSPTTDMAITDNLTMIKGAHTPKFGGLVVRNRKDQNGRSAYPGDISFSTSGNPRTTGYAFADALLGNFRNYTEAQSDPLGFFRFWQVEAYASDNWKVTHNLSFDFGVRYQWHLPTYTQANNMASFDPSKYDPARAVTVNKNGTIVPGSGDRFNGMVRPGDGVPADELTRIPNGNDPFVLAVPAGAPRGFYKAQHNLAPRFSFAWSPEESGAMSVRGGAGLFYDRPEGNLYFSLVNNPPLSLSSQYENGRLAAPGGGSVPALSALGSIDSISPDLKIPRMWQYSVTVQRELTWGVFAEVGYVGSTGQNLIRQPDINQAPFDALAANASLPTKEQANTNYLRPYKGYSAIRMRLSDANSRYNALQVFLSKRRGVVMWTASYTLGSAKDNASGNGDNPEAFQNKDYNWGPSSFDRRHVFVATWTYPLPFFKEQQGIGRALGGWEISGIWRYQSGSPLTITGTTSIGGRRADYLGGDPYVSDADRIPTPGTVYWLNPAAFSVAPNDRLGNGTRGQFIGPAYQVADLSFRKIVRVAGEVKVQIQADLFNAFNKVNFENPSTNLSSASFGRVSSAGPPRNVQLGVRLTF